MNKAFVREPDDDGRSYCPKCGSLGSSTTKAALDRHIAAASRAKIQNIAWYCGFAQCDVAYFTLFDAVVLVSELNSLPYPYDLDAPICACFGLNYDDVEADVADTSPRRIREVLQKSKSDAAQCESLAIDGRCCLPIVQELYMRLRAAEG